jgi:hypothetical protein
MIETRGALERLDEILAVDGLGAVFVGPADLSQALGGPPGADFEDGPVVDAIAARRRAQHRDRRAGRHLQPLARVRAAHGRPRVRFVAMGSALDLWRAAPRRRCELRGADATASPLRVGERRHHAARRAVTSRACACTVPPSSPASATSRRCCWAPRRSG